MLALISLWVVSQSRKRRYLLVGWLWYLITLLPTIGLVQVGSQSMADRYSYVPLIGIFLLSVWQISEWAPDRPVPKAILQIGAASVLIACAVSTFLTSQYWENSILLFRHAIRATRGNHIACRQLGMALINARDLREAESLFRDALRISGGDVLTETYLADVLSWEGNTEEAHRHYLRALRTNPSAAYIHCRVADFCMNTKDPRFHDPERALQEARTACELSQYRNRKMMIELALMCAQNHQFKEASSAAQRALALSVGREEIGKTKQMLEAVCRVETPNN